MDSPTLVVGVYPTDRSPAYALFKPDKARQGRRAYGDDHTDGGSFLVSVQITNDGNIITGGPTTAVDSVVAFLVGDPNFYYAPEGTAPLTGTLHSGSTLDAPANFPSGDTLLIKVAYDESAYERGSSLATVAGRYESWWDLSSSFNTNLCTQPAAT